MSGFEDAMIGPGGLFRGEGVQEIADPGIVSVRDASHAREMFERLRRHAMTTFVLEHVPSFLEATRGLNGLISPSTFATQMPFTNLVIRTGYFPAKPGEDPALRVREENEVLIAREGDRVVCVARMVVEIGGERAPVYHADVRITGPIVNLLATSLYRRTVRFIESPVSRQVRRANGWSTEYREYIVVPKGDLRYESVVRPSEIVKRLRRLHAVRGHLRRVADRTIFVRPYVRGTVGVLVQAKEYRVS